jgi:hypothetical protein
VQAAWSIRRSSRWVWRRMLIHPAEYLVIPRWLADGREAISTAPAA